jgi:hypothetical protein
LLEGDRAAEIFASLSRKSLNLFSRSEAELALVAASLSCALMMQAIDIASDRLLISACGVTQGVTNAAKAQAFPFFFLFLVWSRTEIATRCLFRPARHCGAFCLVGARDCSVLAHLSWRSHAPLCTNSMSG